MVVAFRFELFPTSDGTEKYTGVKKDAAIRALNFYHSTVDLNGYVQDVYPKKPDALNHPCRFR